MITTSSTPIGSLHTPHNGQTYPVLAVEPGDMPSLRRVTVLTSGRGKPLLRVKEVLLSRDGTTSVLGGPVDGGGVWDYCTLTLTEAA